MSFSFLTLLFVAGLIAAWWMIRRKERPQAQAARLITIARRDEPYHCVSIREKQGGCRIAAVFAGRRFLPDEAPRLPLPGCRIRICQCTYRHHSDRRSQDRRNAYDLRRVNWSEHSHERRAPRHGRRHDD